MAGSNKKESFETRVLGPLAQAADRRIHAILTSGTPAADKSKRLQALMRAQKKTLQRLHKKETLKFFSKLGFGLAGGVAGIAGMLWSCAALNTAYQAMAPSLAAFEAPALMLLSSVVGAVTSVMCGMICAEKNSAHCRTLFTHLTEKNARNSLTGKYALALKDAEISATMTVVPIAAAFNRTRQKRGPSPAQKNTAPTPQMPAQRQHASRPSYLKLVK